MRNTTLLDVLKQSSQHGNKGITFIGGSDQSDFLSYRDLYRSARRLLSHLQDKGIRPGEELVFQIDDNKSFLLAFWACLLGGIIPVPLSIGKKEDHKRKLFNVWQVLNRPHLIGSAKDLQRLSAFATAQGMEELEIDVSGHFIELTQLLEASGEGTIHQADEDDIAFIQFSSGSTGQPKGVVLTHKNLITNVRAIAAAANYRPEDSTVSWMPLTHDMGMIGFHINPLLSQMNQYLLPTAVFVRRPAIWMDVAHRYKATVLCSPNFGYKYLMRHCPPSQQFDWELSHVRIVYNGAEPISEVICREFLDRMAQYGLKRTAMCPVYGLAEASLAVSISGLQEEYIACQLDRDQMNIGDEIVPTTDPEKAISFMNVGTAINDCELRIANADNQLAAENVIGYVQIKGDNVTSGYYNNEEATQKVLHEDGWLNTGDLGFLREGALYITGRAKDIIFINGQNYYPHDIEEMALEVDSIELNKIVVGGLFNHEGQKEEVLAFVFHRSGLESFVPIVRQLKAHINLQAGFELDRIIPVKDIPRTTSGKLQRYRLLERYRKGQFAQIEQQLQELLQQAATTLSAIVPAQNDTETTLLKIWKAVLQTDEIGVTHRFFEIGGNSLKAAQIGAKVWKKFQVELPFDLLYEKQTVRELASEIAGCRPQQYEPVPVADTQRYYSLASAQKRLYYSWELDPDSTAYNMPFALKIDGKISADRVEGCIKAMIERHDVFRMTFHPREEPVFCIGESSDFSMGRYQVSPDGLQERLRSLVQPFDLTRAPLLRASLLTLNHFEHILFLDFHHIISDGMSVHHFIGELLALYADIKLPRPSVQFKDYAVWEGAQAMDEVAEQYWQQTFAGDIPLLELPLDKRRPKLLKRTGGKMEFDLGTSLSQQLRSLANQQGCTLHVLLLSLYRVLLAKYSTQEESIIGVPIAGRRHPDVQAMQGMFVNNLAVRNTISGDESFLSLLERESQQMRSALRHQQYAFDDLIQSLDLKRDVSRSPLFDTMFVFQSMGLPVLNNRSIGLSRHFFDPGFSKFDLTMEVFDEANISCALEYADELFDKDTILRLTKHFIHLSEQATRTPSARIADLPLLDTVEYKNIIQDFNNTDRERPRDTCIHHLFEARAKAQPKAIALISGTEKMTYAELNQQAALLAADLASRQVDTNDIIGILLDRSPEFIISLLAVLKTGAAYVPIDTDLPAERIRFILEDSKARLLLTDSKQRELTRQLRQESGLESIELDKWTAAEDLSPLKEQRGTADDLAYVIYTSGTTGRPKGVMIGHDSLVNYIDWATEEYLQGEQAAFPLFTSVSFDLTVTSIFIPLTTGNRLLIYGEDKQSLLLDTVLADNQAEIVKLTPSHLRLLRKSDRFEKRFQSSIRRFIVGGEALEYELAKDIHDLFGGRVEIYNEYGPTEATVGCMIHRFDPAEKTNTVPIGIPAANTQIYVLDAFYKPVATGVKGELYVSGEGLAKAYLYRFELTRDRFVPNPFSAGQWMYKSGDIVRRLASGKLEYIQRVDHQVKINGYRIELAEIEQQLESHPAVSDALVRLEKNEADAAILYAYYCCHDQTNRTDAASLRHFLSERLPYYMMPMHFIALEQIPLTINGKIDYRALPQPVKDEEVLQPRNEMEQHFVSAWESILEMPVTIGDNFFELGGDSIKAVQIASRLAAKGIGIDVKDILTYQTIEQISLRASVRESTHQYDQGIQQGARGLTPIESWFVQQQFENPHHFNQSVLLKLNRAIQMDLLKEAFEMLLEQHDALRLNYRLDEQELYFNNRHLKQPFVIEEFSLTAQELYSGEQELFALFAPLKTQFDLADGLLFKAGVLRVGQRLQYLCITAHHLLVDGISWRILLEDFHQIYQGLEKGQSVELPAKTASSIDWHKALVEYASYEMSIDEINYWNEVSQMEFSLPQDFATEDWTVKNRRSIRGQLNREQTDYLLKEAHQAYKTDVPILLNAALVNTLKDWTAGELFVIEHENHGRHIEGIDVSRTVGWFTAMYPIRLTSQRGGMGEQIKAVKEQMRRVPNNGLGYGIQQYMGAETFPHQKNPSEIRFNYLGQFGRELENDLFSYTNLFSGSEIAEENHLTTKMECNLMIINGCLQLDIAYNSKAHSRLTVERFKDKYLHHLNAVLDHIRSEEDIHFTPSDFDAVDLNEEELDALLG